MKKTMPKQKAKKELSKGHNKILRWIIPLVILALLISYSVPYLIHKPRCEVGYSRDRLEKDGLVYLQCVERGEYEYLESIGDEGIIRERITIQEEKTHLESYKSHWIYGEGNFLLHPAFLIFVYVISIGFFQEEKNEKKKK